MSPGTKKGILLILFFLIVGIALICRNMDRRKIKQAHFVVCAKILSVAAARGGPIIDYEYYFEGEKYSFDGEGCTIETKKKYEQGLQFVLVAIEKKPPK